MKKTNVFLFLLAMLLFGIPAIFAQQVNVNVDLNHKIEPMKPIWAWVGYDEPNYTYMKDGCKLLTDIANLSAVPVHFRAHNLMNTGDGTAALKWGSTNMYTEDKKGRPVYHWNIVDSIFDAYVSRGLRPLVQIGFTPEALSTKPKPYRHHWDPSRPYDEIFTGWAYPPKNYNKWRELVYQWAKHCKERYGDQEVAKWYWEVWNEPDGYLQGSFEDYCKIYDYAVDGLLRALPNAVVGGPHSTGGQRGFEYLRKFLSHCESGKNYATGKTGSPLGYIGFHAKGWPQFKGDTVQMNIGVQIRTVEYGFKVISEFSKYKHLPVIIGEFDPEGCAACSSEYTPQYNYRNGTMYSSTVADSYARLYELSRKYGINLIGAVTWAFEFENQSWFAGFRDLATNGVVKPVLNVFRMFGQMQGELVGATSTGMVPLDTLCKKSVRTTPDVGVLAARGDNNATVMIWNYHDDNVTDVQPAHISLNVDGCGNGNRVLVTHFRIDSRFSNSYAKWLELGSPKSPDSSQMAELMRSSELQLLCSPRWVDVKNGKISLDFELPRQGVSLLKIEK